MHKEAVDALNAMLAAAKEDGKTLLIRSGYRSISDQTSIINNKKRSGLSHREIYSASAPAGYSEHHTGLAFDFVTPNSDALTGAFANTKQYTWLQKHAATYGFVLTYKKSSNGRSTNGTEFEPWHWSYVGTQTARNALVNAACNATGTAKTTGVTSGAKPAGNSGNYGAGKAANLKTQEINKIPTTGDGSTGSGTAFYFGDSIAMEASGTKHITVKGGWVQTSKGKRAGTSAGIDLQALGGTPPAGVLYYLSQHESKLRGKHVVLSSGASNSTKLIPGVGLDQENLGYIKKQLQLLKRAGATVTLMGVADNFYGHTGHARDDNHAKNIDAQLRALAKEYGVEYTGPFKGGSDRVHMANTSEITKKYKSAGAISR